MGAHLTEKINIHNSNRLDVVLVCQLLEEYGWETRHESRISRTLVWTNADQWVVDSVVKDVTMDKCVNCGCNPVLKKDGIYGSEDSDV